MEHSFGVVPVRVVGGEYQVLLIKDHHGNWGFPKGHPDENESPKQAAMRELYEETRLQTKEWIDSPPLLNNYTHTQEKQVEYFIALTQGEAIPQPQEIETLEWLSLEEARQKATFDILKELFPQIEQCLKEL